MKKFLPLVMMVCLFGVRSMAQTNVGIGTNAPASKATISGNLSVGSSYTTTPAPVDGAIIQGRMGLGTSSPDTNAILDMSSTAKGMLMPRLTNVQRTALTVALGIADKGLLIFNTDNNRAEFWDGTQWLSVGAGAGGPPTGTASGDLTGSYPSPTIANSAVNGAKILDGSITSADLATPAVNAANQIFNTLPVGNGGTGQSSLTTNGLVYGNGTSPVNVTPAPSAGQVMMGNASGVPTFTTLSGDATVNGTGGVTIANNAVTYGKMQQVGANKLLGNPTGSSASPSEISLGTGLSLSGTTLNATGTGGTVTSVATGAGLTGGPITGSGTISIPAAGVTNAMLANNSVTVTPGTGLSGGGTVALGGTITVTNTGDLSSTNEAQTLAGSGTTDINLTNVSGTGGGTITLAGTGATSVTRSGNTFTINSTNSGGTVTGVTASNGITSSGGAAPNITLGGTLTSPTTITTPTTGNNLTINSTVAASTTANAETVGNLVVNRSNPGGTGGELTIRNSGGAATLNSSAVLAFETDGSTAFDAAGVNNSNAEIRAINTAANNGADLVFSNWSGAAEVERLRMTATGNVGIGTTPLILPSVPLEVASTGPTELRISSTLGSATAYGSSQLSFVSNKGAAIEWRPAYIATQDGNGGGTYTGRMDFYTNGTGSGNKYGSTYAMSVMNGTVGIGTVTPRNTLDVNGSAVVRGGLILSGGSTSYTYYTTAGVTTPYASMYGGSPELFANGDNHAGGGIAISDDGGFYDYNDTYITYNGSGGLKVAGASGASSTGTLIVQGLGTGLVKSTAGVIGLAAAGDIPSLSGSYVDLTSAQTAAGIKTWSAQAKFSNAIQPSAGAATTNGLYFPTDAFGGSGDAAWMRYYARAGESATLELGTSNDVDDHIALMPSGNVGVGNNAPAYKLDVTGDVNTTTGYRVGGAAASGSYLRGNGTQFVSSTIPAADIPAGSGNYIQNQFSAAQSAEMYISGRGRFQKSLFVSMDNTTGGGITLSDDGDIVDMNDAFVQMRFSYGVKVMNGNGAAGTGIAAQIASTSANYTYFNAGNVGIGTITPVSRFHISGGVPSGTLMSLTSGTVAAIENGTGNNYLNFRNSVDNSTYGGMIFTDNNLGGYIVFKNCCGGNGDDMIYGSYTDHVFQNGTAGTVDGNTETMRIKQNGRVGIATNNPQATLDVNGDARFGCRAGFWAVADGRICMETTMRGPAGVWVAIGACKTVGPGSRVCTHTDFQQACGAGFAPYGGVGTGWYGDHGVSSGGNWDDEYGTWNGAACADNNDGSAFDGGAGLSYNYRCCY